MGFDVGAAVVKKKLLIELRTRLPDPFGDEAKMNDIVPAQEQADDVDVRAHADDAGLVDVEEEKQADDVDAGMEGPMTMMSWPAPKVIALPKLELLIRAYLQKVAFDVNRLLGDDELAELLRQEFDMPAQ